VFLCWDMARGAWAESKSARAREVAALRLGIELGMSLIDTAEMYGDGGAEEVVAEAIYGQS
jgi:aryl-alcohol dehydrogenase-like predicted oxidoreductase